MGNSVSSSQEHRYRPSVRSFSFGAPPHRPQPSGRRKSKGRRKDNAETESRKGVNGDEASGTTSNVQSETTTRDEESFKIKHTAKLIPGTNRHSVPTPTQSSLSTSKSSSAEDQDDTITRETVERVTREDDTDAPHIAAKKYMLKEGQVGPVIGDPEVESTEKELENNNAVPNGEEDQDSHSRPALSRSSSRSTTSSNTGTTSTTSSSEPATFPTLITWTQGGRKVYVTGTFNSWSRKLALVKSTKDFASVLDLPPGVHQFKFIVDNEWKCSSELPTLIDAEGNMVNFIEVKEPKPIDEMEESGGRKGRRRGSSPGKYTREFPKYLRGLMGNDQVVLQAQSVGHQSSAHTDSGPLPKTTTETYSESIKYVQPVHPSASISMLGSASPEASQSALQRSSMADSGTPLQGHAVFSGLPLDTRSNSTDTSRVPISSSPVSTTTTHSIPSVSAVPATPPGRSMTPMFPLNQKSASVAETSAVTVTQRATSPAPHLPTPPPIPPSHPPYASDKLNTAYPVHPSQKRAASPTVFSSRPTAQRRNTFAGLSTKTKARQEHSVVVMLQSPDTSSGAASLSESEESAGASVDDDDDSEPPVLPAHLTRVILNPQPNVQSNKSAKLDTHGGSSRNRARSLPNHSHHNSANSAHGHGIPGVSMDVLPVPNRVCLNHLCTCSIKNGTMAVAVTSRYRGKFITTVLYKPVVF